MAAVSAPLGSILASGQPRACRGPRGGSFRLRQHLHLHARPGAHLHLPGFMHPPLPPHLHLPGFMHPPLPPHLHLAGAGAFRRGLFFAGLLGLLGLLARPALVRLFLGGALESALLLGPFDRRAYLLVGQGRLAPLAAARPEAVHALGQVPRGPCPEGARVDQEYGRNLLLRHVPAGLCALRQFRQDRAGAHQARLVPYVLYGLD